MTKLKKWDGWMTIFGFLVKSSNRNGIMRVAKKKQRNIKISLSSRKKVMEHIDVLCEKAG